MVIMLTIGRKTDLYIELTISTSMYPQLMSSRVHCAAGVVLEVYRCATCAQLDGAVVIVLHANRAQ